MNFQSLQSSTQEAENESPFSNKSLSDENSEFTEADAAKQKTPYSCSFKIDHQFSGGSRELRDILVKFHKLLNILEQEPEKQLKNSNARKAKHKPVIESQTNNEDGIQLEFDFYEPQQNEEDESDSNDSKPMSELQKQLQGQNPEYQVHNMITTEIIKSLSNKNPRLKIYNVGAKNAYKIACNIREIMSHLPYALASKNNRLRADLEAKGKKI